jgi:hypothetical protein
MKLRAFSGTFRENNERFFRENVNGKFICNIYKRTYIYTHPGGRSGEMGIISDEDMDKYFIRPNGANLYFKEVINSKEIKGDQ